MFNKRISLISLFIALLIQSSIYASEKFLDVERFEGVELGTGMMGKITCGNTNSVTLKGRAKDLKDITVKIKSGNLTVNRHSSAGNMLSNLFHQNENHSIEVDIVSTSPLSSIEVSTGATITVPGCAINTKYLELELSTGASATVEGYTEKLDLELSTGAEFNSRGPNFKIDSVNVDLSTGAIANLCGANSVKGDASTGATITVAENVDPSNIDLSLGAEVSSYRCK